MSRPAGLPKKSTYLTRPTPSKTLNNNYAFSPEIQSLLSHIIQGLREKKAEDITLIELAPLEYAPADAYVIAHAGSHRQVEAIAESVEEQVGKHLREKPWHREGFENKEWILLDYVHVVVHVMLEETRRFYDLEELWNDARRIDDPHLLNHT